MMCSYLRIECSQKEITNYKERKRESLAIITKILLIIWLRMGKLLLKLAAAKTFKADSLEEIFFSGMIDNVRIDSVIPFILKMDLPALNKELGK